MAEEFPHGTTPLNGASTMPDQVGTEKLAERPSVDLFKSIFESESESESDEGDESDGGRSFPKAPDPDSSPSATHVELKGALQASANKSLPQHGYGSDPSEECATDSALPTPSVTQSTIEGVGDERTRSKAKESSSEERGHDGASEVTGANGQERNRNEMKRSGEKRKRKHKLDSKHKHSSKSKKHRKHGHKRRSSSRK